MKELKNSNKDIDSPSSRINKGGSYRRVYKGNTPRSNSSIISSGTEKSSDKSLSEKLSQFELESSIDENNQRTELESE